MNKLFMIKLIYYQKNERAIADDGRYFDPKISQCLLNTNIPGKNT